MSLPTETNGAATPDTEPAGGEDTPVDVGRIPDHTATDNEPPSSPEPPRTMPWDRLRTSAKSATDASSSTPKPGRKKRPGSDAEVPALPRGFTNDLADVYKTIGAFLVPFDQVCGTAIIDAAPKCAESLTSYARANADVRRILLKLVGTSAVGAIIAAHTPIIMAIAMHHIAPLMNRDSSNPQANGYGEPVYGQNGIRFSPDGQGWSKTGMGFSPG